MDFHAVGVTFPPPLSTKPQFEGLMTSVVFPDHDQKGGAKRHGSREAAKMFFGCWWNRGSSYEQWKKGRVLLCRVYNIGDEKLPIYVGSIS